MKLSEYITRVRDQIQEPSALKWTDVEIVRYLNHAVMYLFRWQADADQSYHNAEISLLGSAATATHSSQYLYTLPRWVYRVAHVRIKKTSTESRGSEIPAGSQLDANEGWHFDTFKRLRVVGYGTAQDLTVMVAKIPSRLHQGTTPAAGTSTTLITANLPTASFSSNYEYESETDAYLNALVEVTGVADASRDPVGQVRRVTASSRTHAGSGVYRVTMTVEPSWTVTPAASDTYELHPEVDDAHARLLVLMTAQACFQKHNNLGGIESIKPEMLEERRRFIDSSRPRDDGRPKHWNMGAEPSFRRDPDRHNYFYGWSWIA